MVGNFTFPFPLLAHTRVHLSHVNHREMRRKKDAVHRKEEAVHPGPALASTMDQEPWTRARPVNPTEHVVLYTAATYRAKAQPISSPTGPVWTRPVLTVDRSTLTVDLAPHVSDTVLLDPHVRW
jgi:hypothetical protein